MEIIIMLLVLISIVLSLITLISLNKSKGTTVIEESDKKELKDAFSNNVKIISDSLSTSNDRTADVLKEKLQSMNDMLKAISEATNTALEQVSRAQSDEFAKIRLTLQENIKVLQEGNSSELEKVRAALQESIKLLQENNERKLAEIQSVVDEKLTKTLNDRFKDSFTILTEQLEKVNKTIGEMQTISNDVGNLTKMLSGVKTTGIFGEIQLEAIIEQILAPEQYEKNIVTKELGREPVEFAVKMPGYNGEKVLMPIDSKFPYTAYNDMQTAYQNNDFAEFENKKKQLKQTVINMAKDIKEKYICPPRTTKFGVMFLPFEGLYAEVVKMGLVETLQQQYSVTVAGPTTMAALLNSLQMGFQTLAIQKKSNEVWEILSAVKAEFVKFDAILLNIQKRLTTTNSDLDELIGKRTRAISRKLRDVELTTVNSSELLGVSTDIEE